MPSKSYDYIVAGGGTAGCTLAARLSEDPSVSVLLLEAGGRDWHPLYEVPAGFAKMTKGIGSWGYSTVPQKHMNGRVFWYTQGKVLGGGSSVNAQIYTRGHPSDFDGWADLGCKGWGYEDILPYFRRSEDNDTYDNDLHGRGGPIGVSQPRAPLPICDAFIAAAGEAGYPHNKDLTGRDIFGFGYYQLTQRHGRRSSAVSGQLAPRQGSGEPHGADEPACAACADRERTRHRRRAGGCGCGRHGRHPRRAGGDRVVGHRRLGQAARCCRASGRPTT